MKVLLLLLLLAAAARAGISCQAAAQGGAMVAGDTRVVTVVAVYTPGSCQCTFLPQPDADITCCTDETWTPTAVDLIGACACTFTAHQTIPANTFNFYACADTMT